MLDRTIFVVIDELTRNSGRLILGYIICSACRLLLLISLYYDNTDFGTFSTANVVENAIFLTNHNALLMARKQAC